MIKSSLIKGKWLIKKQLLFISLLALLLIFSLASDKFFSITNLVLILSQVSIVGLVACAMTYVMIGGNFDLTVGVVITMGALLSIDLHDKIGPVWGIVLPLIVGLCTGAICGFFIGYLKINSLIITIGLSSIIQGTTLLYTSGRQAQIKAPDETWFAAIGRGTIGKIPVPIVLLIIAVVIFYFVLKKTTFGTKLYAVGGNAIASRFSGINDRKIILITFLLSGFMAALAGVVLGSRLMTFQLNLGNGYEFDVLSGVILGGTSLAGGEGSVVRTFIGILIIGVLANGFIMLGFQYYFQWIIQGIIIIGVIYADSVSKRNVTMA